METPDAAPSVLRKWRLLTVCVGANLLEAVLVLALAPSADLSLAPQASSIGPFGVFHDLRWLSVYSNSWWSPAEIAGVLGLRALLMAACVRWAWPSAGDPRSGDTHVPALPSWLRLWGRGAGASALLSVFLWPSVAVLFASAVVPVSWLFIAAVPAAVFVSMIVQPVAVRTGWWRRALPIRAVGWALLSFLVATVAGVLISAMSSVPEAALGIAALGGLFNAWAWHGTVRAVVLPAHADRIRPVVPVALAGLVGGVVAGTLVGFTQARQTEVQSTRLQEAHAIAFDAGPPVLIVDGYGSNWTGVKDHPVPGAWSETHFSYRGVSPAGQALPYTSKDTVKPLKTLVRLLASQVASVAQTDRRPVSLVAESEGAILAEAYLHSTPLAPVSTAILLSPLLSSVAVSYPAGGSDGWGQAGEWGMAALGNAFQSSAPIDLSPQNHFLRSIVADGPLVRRLDSCPVPGVRQVGLLSLADAVGVPPHLRPSFRTIVVPFFHGGMLQRASLDRTVGRLLAHLPVAGDHLMSTLASAVSWAASSWQVPTLPDSYFARTVTGPPRNQCATVDADLAGVIWGSASR
ncbi:MAG TPA: hypothetical protein VFZ97_07050 [Acidimicrobiales bacterium]